MDMANLQELVAKAGHVHDLGQERREGIAAVVGEAVDVLSARLKGLPGYWSCTLVLASDLDMVEASMFKARCVLATGGSADDGFIVAVVPVNVLVNLKGDGRTADGWVLQHGGEAAIFKHFTDAASLVDLLLKDLLHAVSVKDKTVFARIAPTFRVGFA